jgi:hypothetical protein
LGYRALFYYTGPHFYLPLIASFDLPSSFMINAFAYANYYNLNATQRSDSSYYWGGEDPPDTRTYLFINGITTGVGLGLKYSGRSFYIMPSIEYFTTIVDFSDDPAQVAIKGFVINISFGWADKKKEEYQLIQMHKILKPIEPVKEQDFTL